jgi:hypothetical protein
MCRQVTKLPDRRTAAVGAKRTFMPNSILSMSMSWKWRLISKYVKPYRHGYAHAPCDRYPSQTTDISPMPALIETGTRVGAAGGVGPQSSATAKNTDVGCSSRCSDPPPNWIGYRSRRVVNSAPSSATKTAISSAGSVLLALAETRCIAPGGSKNDCPTSNVSRGPPLSCERTWPLVT